MSNTDQLIQNYYDYFNRQDVTSFLSLLDENVVHDINQGGREVGKERFAEFMERMNRCYKETVKDLVVMQSADGSHAAAEFTLEGEYLISEGGLPPARGQKYFLTCGAFFQIKNGKICRISNFYNFPEWIAQVS